MPRSAGRLNAAAAGGRFGTGRAVCGACDLAQAGVRPIVDRARQRRWTRVRKDVEAFWRGRRVQSGKQRAVRRGRRRYFFRRQAEQLASRIRTAARFCRRFAAHGCAGGDSLGGQAAHRHRPACEPWSKTCARRSSRLGGEVRFETKLDGLLDRGWTRDLAAVKLKTAEKRRRPSACSVILAIGHSARDSFRDAELDAGAEMSAEAIFHRRAH